MTTEPHSYLKHDLITLAVIVLIVAAAVAALWYFESTRGFFTSLAERYLSLPKAS